MMVQEVEGPVVVACWEVVGAGAMVVDVEMVEVGVAGWAVVQVAA